MKAMINGNILFFGENNIHLTKHTLPLSACTHLVCKLGMGASHSEHGLVCYTPGFLENIFFVFKMNFA